MLINWLTLAAIAFAVTFLVGLLSDDLCPQWFNYRWGFLYAL